MEPRVPESTPGIRLVDRRERAPQLFALRRERDGAFESPPGAGADRPGRAGPWRVRPRSRRGPPRGAPPARNRRRLPGSSPARSDGGRERAAGRRWRAQCPPRRRAATGHGRGGRAHARRRRAPRTQLGALRQAAGKRLDQQPVGAHGIAVPFEEQVAQVQFRRDVARFLFERLLVTALRLRGPPELLEDLRLVAERSGGARAVRPWTGLPSPLAPR